MPVAWPCHVPHLPDFPPRPCRHCRPPARRRVVPTPATAPPATDQTDTAHQCAIVECVCACLTARHTGKSSSHKKRLVEVKPSCRTCALQTVHADTICRYFVTVGAGVDGGPVRCDVTVQRGTAHSSHKDLSAHMSGAARLRCEFLHLRLRARACLRAWPSSASARNCWASMILSVPNCISSRS